MPSAAKSPEEQMQRLLAKIVHDATTGCWVWVGSKTTQGYGQICISYVKYAAHRIMYELHNSVSLGGLIVCHRCDTPSCVNPEHLFAGTDADNYADMVSKGRRRLVRGERQGSAKLTVESVRAIRADDRPQPEIAADYGITRSHVGNLKARRAWKHVD